MVADVLGRKGIDRSTFSSHHCLDAILMLVINLDIRNDTCLLSLPQHEMGAYWVSNQLEICQWTRFRHCCHRFYKRLESISGKPLPLAFLLEGLEETYLFLLSMPESMPPLTCLPLLFLREDKIANSCHLDRQSLFLDFLQLRRDILLIFKQGITYIFSFSYDKYR